MQASSLSRVTELRGEVGMSKHMSLSSGCAVGGRAGLAVLTDPIVGLPVACRFGGGGAARKSSVECIDERGRLGWGDGGSLHFIPSLRQREHSGASLLHLTLADRHCVHGRMRLCNTSGSLPPVSSSRSGQSSRSSEGIDIPGVDIDGMGTNGPWKSGLSLKSCDCRGASSRRASSVRGTTPESLGRGGSAFTRFGGSRRQRSGSFDSSLSSERISLGIGGLGWATITFSVASDHSAQEARAPAAEAIRGLSKVFYV